LESQAWPANSELRPKFHTPHELQGLQEWGWAVGCNVRIKYRWAAGDAERTRKYAAELVALAAGRHPGRGRIEHT
jgi:hypothetical protein